MNKVHVVGKDWDTCLRTQFLYIKKNFKDNLDVFSGLKADGQAEVMYVDYGNNEYTEKDALKEIQQQFMSLPAQAVQCRLSGKVYSLW